MAANTSTTISSSGGMDKRLLKAATAGDAISMKDMASQDPGILLGTTPWRNNCLHISSVHGHEGFCKDVLELEESLINAANLDKKTPLITAVTNGHASLASILLGRHRYVVGFRQSILQQDMDGFNALQHAIRSGHEDLALELTAAEHALSQAVSKHNESPMFIATMRNFTRVIEELLKIPDSSHVGPYERNALHATVRSGNEGYEVNKQGSTLLVSAAFRGHVDIAQEILKHCPDAPQRQEDGSTWLHSAVSSGNAEFVEFILGTPQLCKLVNMKDHNGKTALHQAVQKCNPRIVASLLSHEGIDTTVLDDHATSAAWELSHIVQNAKTLNWNEVIMLMSKACPQDAIVLHNIHVQAKRQATDASRMDAKSLTPTYTRNTLLVAILIATITFTAAFTLPGGFDNSAGSEGLPAMSQKVAFQAFLIFDTLAMCSSFVVAFICIIARWEDYEFLVYYRSFTKELMWFAYMATTTAFSTALYTVLAPRIYWLAITVCVLVASLPILTKLLGEWPVLKLRFRLGKSFRSDLLDMV